MRRMLVIVILGAFLVAALPAQAARPSKAQIKHNVAVLKERLRDNPGLATRKPRVTVAPRGGGARAAQFLATCTTSDGDAPSYLGIRWAVFWSWSTVCTGSVPIFAVVASAMISPTGLSDSDNQAGVMAAGVAGRLEGPSGTWNHTSNVSWTAPPGFQLFPTGVCVGAGTNVNTCVYNHALPLFSGIVPSPS